MNEIELDSVNEYSSYTSPNTAATIVPEIAVLPDIAYQSGYYTPAPAITATEIPSGGVSGNVLSSLSRGANNLLDFYGKVVSVEQSASNAKLNRQITAANTDIAKIQAVGAVDVARARAGAAVANAVRDAEKSRDGTNQVAAAVSDNKLTIIIAIAGLAFAVWQYRNKA